MNLQRETDLGNKLMVIGGMEGARWGERILRQFGMDMYMDSLSKWSLYYPWSSFWVDGIYSLILEDMEMSCEVK